MPPTLDVRPIRSKSRSHDRSRGQVAVIFALSIVLFVGLCAVVVDIAFYWVTTLKVQRAADAAALAGAVYLPGDRTTAYAEARASAIQNDYTGGGSVTVTPVQDTGDPRQLDVTIAASSPAFFARVLGVTSFPVTRSAKGIYVLPVPMGSPLAYYGVGDLFVNQTTPNPPTLYTAASVGPYVSVTPTTWTTPNNGWTTATSYATSLTNGQVQQWSTLNIPAGSIGATIDGIVVTIHSKVSSGGANCQVKAELTWNGGVATPTWGSLPQSTPMPPGLTAADTAYNLGSKTVPGTWDSSHTWVKADFTNANFRVRLTYVKGTGCGTVSVNNLAATVYSHTDNAPTTAMKKTAVVDPDGTTLASQGAWGAVIAKGGQQGNGDAYAPANNGASANAKYDPLGYKYVISLPSGGTVRVFDPGYCAMGSNGVGGSLGVGDHWIGTVGPAFSTYYTLWNSNGKVGLDYPAWSQLYTSGALFESQTGYDPANTAPGVASGTLAGATSGCDPYHNAWWTIPTGNLGAGTYVLQVQTSKTRPPSGSNDPSVNNGTSAENMWAIEAAGANAQVYGNGRMTVYNNLSYDAAVGGTQSQQFYLAKIDQATGAGKTALIDLFDPGDLASGATGTLRVFSPDGGTSHAVSFSYTTDSNCAAKTGTSPCSGTNVSSITTTSPSGQATNNTWIHISVPLASTYGQAGLWQGGWWQIQYAIDRGGNDTTTWEVSVSGNPVHLLMP
jgi:Flp pilus assembly protein TadG